jgi:hypothetical protein
MKSKEKLQELKLRLYNPIKNDELQQNYYDVIEKDLDRLEKLDKVIKILKPFLRDIIIMEESGIEWYGFKEEPYYFIADADPFPLDKEQYNLLKEVFG